MQFLKGNLASDSWGLKTHPELGTKPTLREIISRDTETTILFDTKVTCGISKINCFQQTLSTPNSERSFSPADVGVLKNISRSRRIVLKELMFVIMCCRREAEQRKALVQIRAKTSQDLLPGHHTQNTQEDMWLGS